VNTYNTDNLAVAAYLDINGLKYLGFNLGTGRNGKSMVMFRFEDEKGIAIDLERSYRNSKEKLYRDSILFFRNEVYRATEEKGN
jgi:hypothetical protein